MPSRRQPLSSHPMPLPPLSPLTRAAGGSSLRVPAGLAWQDLCPKDTAHFRRLCTEWGYDVRRSNNPRVGCYLLAIDDAVDPPKVMGFIPTDADKAKDGNAPNPMLLVLAPLPGPGRQFE